mmetsp:Transcript_10481/g.27190  ORF Transcript_10481/g.27190 Transcript_10481/m.27190 type:complete len:353 (-) Transcript_10481:362-1420(-)
MKAKALLPAIAANVHVAALLAFGLLLFVRRARRGRRAPPAPGELAMERALGARAPQRFNRYCSDESAMRAEAWRPRADDVIVCTFPKTGTTLVQQICQMIRADGAMDFDEITQVQPWTDLAYDVGQDLDAAHKHWPRVFKSHQRPAAVQRGCKYIFTLRDPVGTLLSWFEFAHAHGHPVVSKYASVDEYTVEDDHFFSDAIYGTSVFGFFAEAWVIRHLPNVLVLSYEGLCERPAEHVDMIARFLGLELTRAQLARAVERSSRTFMAEHAHRFDDGWTSAQQARLGRAKCVLKATPKVNRESKRGAAALAPHAHATLSHAWEETVTPRTGLASYAEMVRVLADEQRESMACR